MKRIYEQLIGDHFANNRQRPFRVGLKMTEPEGEGSERHERNNVSSSLTDRFLHSPIGELSFSPFSCSARRGALNTFSSLQLHSFFAIIWGSGGVVYSKGDKSW